MGDIADSIIDGVLCEWCGEYIGNAVGYPRKCSSCKSEEKARNKKRSKGKRNQSYNHGKQK